MSKNKKDRPSINVRKDAEKEVVFHYKREERLSMPSAPKLNYGRKGIFKNNRALLILFLDLIIILILIFVFFRFFYQPGDVAAIGEYHFSLKGFIYEDKVYVALYIRSTGNKSSKTVSQSGFSILFYLKGRERNSQHAEISLPPRKNNEVIVRKSIPFNGNQTILYAEVKIGNKREVLFKKLSR